MVKSAKVDLLIFSVFILFQLLFCVIGSVIVDNKDHLETVVSDDC